MKALSVAVMLVMALPAEARADIAPDAILHTLAAVKTSRAHFVETRHLAMLTAPVIASGTLTYTAPGHVEKQTLVPASETLTIDGDTLTLVNASGTRTLGVSDVPEIGALVTAMRGTLSGDTAALCQRFDLTATGDSAHWVLLLQPRQATVQHLIQYVRITGSGLSLAEVDTLQTDGDESDMRIVEDHP